MPHSIRTLLDTPRFSVIEHEVLLPDGQRATCATIRHPGSVVILPWVDADQICLIRNRRLSVDRFLLELPAGTCEPQETPLETARRELQEETGYVAATLQELVEFLPAPGMTDERMRVYVATNLTAGPPAREANEQIENLVLPWEDVLAMADRGEIEDGKTLLTLWHYARRIA